MSIFSQRHCYRSLERAFQRESIDANLRAKLWNILKITIWDRFVTEYGVKCEIDQLVHRIWFNYFNKDLDKLPDLYNGRDGAYNLIKDYFFKCKWFEVYDLLETIVNDQSSLISDGFCPDKTDNSKPFYNLP